MEPVKRYTTKWIADVLDIPHSEMLARLSDFADKHQDVIRYFSNVPLIRPAPSLTDGYELCMDPAFQCVGERAGELFVAMRKKDEDTMVKPIKPLASLMQETDAQSPTQQKVEFQVEEFSPDNITTIVNVVNYLESNETSLIARDVLSKFLTERGIPDPIPAWENMRGKVEK